MSYKNQIKTDNEDINMFHVDVLGRRQSYSRTYCSVVPYLAAKLADAYFTDSGTFIYECFKD